MKTENYLEELIIGFWNSCKSKPKISMPGWYDLDFNIFLTSLLEYSKNGNNPLNEYHALINLSWEAERNFQNSTYGKPVLEKDEADYYRNLLMGECFWNIEKLFPKKDVDKMLKYIREAEFTHAEYFLNLSKRLLTKSRKSKQIIENTNLGILELSYDKTKRVYHLVGKDYKESGGASKIQQKLFIIIKV